jgi:hypothetical protein
VWFELRWGQFNVLALAATAWGLFLSTRARTRRAVGAWVVAEGIQLKL